MLDCSKIPYQDKGCHAIAGFIISLIVGILAVYTIAGYDYPQTYGLVAGVVAGVLKEVWDYFRYGVFDKWDLFFTVVGAIFGGAVVTFL